MSPSWQSQVDAFLANYEGITHRRYRDSLAAFRVWYRQSYNAAPDAKLLTDEEVRDYRAFLTGVKGYKAATVNAYLRRCGLSCVTRAARSRSRVCARPGR